MPFQCGECESTFPEKKNLNRHIKTKHQKGEQFQCEHCEYKCTRKDNLARHLVKAHVTPQKRKLESQPEAQVKKIYKEDDIFYSDDNEMDFDEAPPPTPPQPPPPPATPTNHSPPTRHPCKDCGKSFTLTKNLYRHIRNHHEHNHLCETCGKSFGNNEVYENHKCMVKQKVKTRNNIVIDND